MPSGMAAVKPLMCACLFSFFVLPALSNIILSSAIDIHVPSSLQQLWTEALEGSEV
jgi:hypothetical protein